MQSRWGRGTRSHTVPSPSPYILKASKRGSYCKFKPSSRLAAICTIVVRLLGRTNIFLSTTAQTVSAVPGCALIWVLLGPRGTATPPPTGFTGNVTIGERITCTKCNLLNLWYLSQHISTLTAMRFVCKVIHIYTHEISNVLSFSNKR